jgi:hypothetical protein
MGLSGRRSHRQQEPEPIPQQQSALTSKEEAWPLELLGGEQQKMVFVGFGEFELRVKLGSF